MGSCANARTFAGTDSKFLPLRFFAGLVNPRAGVVRQSCLQGEYCRDDRTNAPKSVVYTADGAAREPLDSRHLIAISS